MASIDIYRYQLCGTLAGIPVHHPVEEMTRDFTAGPGDLVLGHGSGGWPAAVIPGTRAVREFLEHVTIELVELGEKYLRPGAEPSGLLEYATENELSEEALDTLAGNIYIPRLDEELFGGETWNGDAWVDFVGWAKQSPGVTYDREVHGRIEMWMALSLGEYLVVSGRDIITAGLERTGRRPLSARDQRTLDAVAGWVSRAPMFANVVTLPPGYAVGGRGAEMQPDVRS